MAQLNPIEVIILSIFFQIFHLLNKYSIEMFHREETVLIHTRTK